mmetsp:Transcript_9427/g.18031  ORF Transcript_9427/g.18031 Transcript_9427/m.18031 type:complete len:203 (+) Transcript_9427:904-1512(+)
MVFLFTRPIDPSMYSVAHEFLAPNRRSNLECNHPLQSTTACLARLLGCRRHGRARGSAHSAITCRDAQMVSCCRCFVVYSRHFICTCIAIFGVRGCCGSPCGPRRPASKLALPATVLCTVSGPRQRWAQREKKWKWCHKRYYCFPHCIDFGLRNAALVLPNGRRSLGSDRSFWWYCRSGSRGRFGSRDRKMVWSKCLDILDR